MTNTTMIQLQTNNPMLKNMQNKKLKIPILAMVFILGMATVALSLTILVKINKKFSPNEFNNENLEITSKLLRRSTKTSLVDSIHIDEVMSYLNELQRIGTLENGTRTVDSLGFDGTLYFIKNYLTANTNYKLTTSIFDIVQPALARQPVFISSINGNVTNHTFSRIQSQTEFFYVDFTRSANFNDYVDVTVIPNVGCSEDDWRKADPLPAGRVVLVKRGGCAFEEKSKLASKNNATAILFYNDGESSSRMSPLFITLGQNNTLPALFLSYALGHRLATVAQTRSGIVRVLLKIVRRKELPFFSANLCADTPTGDPTQTIVIGSHSDSVAAGPGINDNGSGSAANLALAVTLARLFRTPTYPKYKYRIRFCWWGAEEEGLLGSDFHVKQAKLAAAVGERLSDYLINLNYDMLGSPNYIFGIYDGRTARTDTPSQALPGSNKVTALFRQWFQSNKLPWDYTDFSGRSDYGPFLAEGIVAGGLFSGADDIKTQKERDKYDQMLGQGLGGIADSKQDPCYHRACDTIQNVNPFAYEKMIQAAAYVLESLGQQDDLRTWLYPSIELQHLRARSNKQQLHQLSIHQYSSLTARYDTFLTA